MCGFCNVCVLSCVGVCVHGFCNMCVCVCVLGCCCNVWVSVCISFVMCGYFGNMRTCIYFVFVLLFLCIFILTLLLNIISYIFLLFMNWYCYVCSFLYILFSSCHLSLLHYPD